jgi:hypothetical protein
MVLLATFVALIISAVLLIAALEKTRAPALTAATLRDLGIPHALTLPATRLLTLTEFSIAIAVLFTPMSILVRAAIVALAVAFAVAGIIAMRADEPLRCSCFGPRSSYLGWRQIVALIPWFAGVAVLSFETPSLEGALLFALTAFLIGAIRLVRLARAFVQARGDRRSGQEMLLWLPSY